MWADPIAERVKDCRGQNQDNDCFIYIRLQPGRSFYSSKAKVDSGINRIPRDPQIGIVVVFETLRISMHFSVEQILE